MNLANRITIARILLIPIFIVLFTKYPDWKLLDPLADKLLISAALILLVSQQMLYAWVALVIVAREVIITGIRLVAASQKIVLQADQYGKIKMVSQVVAITAVMFANHPFTFFTNIPFDQILIYIALIITVYSGFNYIKNNYRSLKLERWG
ncbi:CDP-diacylglycerol--glycerol-3-phosphate 3-phosphatidyltransferase [Paenibacillus sp. G2S3]|uniref:CDP-alcohol phosphatidyltransferase family protein n=1 Tax=Paenibacillus sp. G2S3 TaxID=3047872 RepID=UPI0024C0F92E|nr:CDP-alcohol phosphatidyltransferase family protein [Paenibacillus sp. G2S3]WHY21988.1 CDP-diacylglycerol--glycerol-3-phosphate 3-phosphatidyltransferase [Paenibacillus sp. G2S3]